MTEKEVTVTMPASKWQELIRWATIGREVEDMPSWSSLRRSQMRPPKEWDCLQDGTVGGLGPYATPLDAMRGIGWIKT